MRDILPVNVFHIHTKIRHEKDTDDLDLLVGHDYVRMHIQGVDACGVGRDGR